MNYIFPSDGITGRNVARTLAELGDRVVLAHSITAVPACGAGRIVVSGSHGGLYSAACALALGVPAAVFNDASGGRDAAGVAGLELLQQHGLPGLAVAHTSARIGDAADAWQRGQVSEANAAARDCGVRTGMTLPQACALLPVGPRAPVRSSLLTEARHALDLGLAVPVRVLDSNSLVQTDDAGAIVVTGSHGGLLGGAPATAIKHAVFAAFYNDAGVGIDDAGISRLPALDARRIAGVAVAASSARIGDGLSTWADGVTSFVNRTAAGFGVVPGMTVQEAVRRLAGALSSIPSKEK